MIKRHSWDLKKNVCINKWHSRKRECKLKCPYLKIPNFPNSTFATGVNFFKLKKKKKGRRYFLEKLNQRTKTRKNKSKNHRAERKRYSPDFAAKNCRLQTLLHTFPQSRTKVLKFCMYCIITFHHIPHRLWQFPRIHVVKQKWTNNEDQEKIQVKDQEPGTIKTTICTVYVHHIEA